MVKSWLSTYWFGHLLFGASFSLRFLVYNQSSFANGWDAYFYIVQIKSYLEEGAMHSSRVSLFYPLLLIIQFLTSNYELTYKLVSALLVGAFSFQLFRTVKFLSPESNMGYLAGSFTLFSPQLTYFGVQFPKNLMGVVVLLLLIECVLRSKWVRLIFVNIVGLLVHKMTAGLSLMVLPLAILGNRLKVVWMKFALILVLIITIVFCLFPIPRILMNFAGVDFGSPVCAGWEFIKTIRESVTTEWIIEIIGLYLLFVWVMIHSLSTKRVSFHWYVVLLLLLGLTFPLLQWSVLGLSYRFLMVFLILSPLLLGYFQWKLKPVWLASLCAFFGLSGIYTASSYPYQKLDPPYHTYDYLTNKIEELHLSPELIIMHKALAEYYTFQTTKDALPWEPEYSIDQEKLWRVAYGISPKELVYFTRDVATTDAQVYKLSPSYVLVREDAWKTAIKKIEEEDPEFFMELMTWKNPHEIRPDYLLQGNRSETGE